MVTTVRLTARARRLVLAFAACAAIGVLGGATPAGAQGAWCADYGGPAGGTNCGFYTYKQCRAAISGIGGICRPSPWTADGRPKKRKYRRTY